MKNRVKELRGAHGLSQQALGDALPIVGGWTLFVNQVRIWKKLTGGER
jgi:transcriptional regulator with XRE-family HTH domain